MHVFWLWEKTLCSRSQVPGNFILNDGGIVASSTYLTASDIWRQLRKARRREDHLDKRRSCTCRTFNLCALFKLVSLVLAFFVPTIIILFIKRLFFSEGVIKTIWNMYIKVKNAMTGDTSMITVSKLTSVSEVKDMVKEKYDTYFNMKNY